MLITSRGLFPRMFSSAQFFHCLYKASVRVSRALFVPAALLSTLFAESGSSSPSAFLSAGTSPCHLPPTAVYSSSWSFLSGHQQLFPVDSAYVCTKTSIPIVLFTQIRLHQNQFLLLPPHKLSPLTTSVIVGQVRASQIRFVAMRQQTTEQMFWSSPCLLSKYHLPKQRQCQQAEKKTGET